MTSTIFQQYVELEAKIKALEDAKKDMRVQIIEAIKEETKGTGEKSVHNEFGRFTKVETAVWRFSDSLVSFEKEVGQKIKEMRDEVSKRKMWAKGHGKAEQIDTVVSLTFSPVSK